MCFLRSAYCEAVWFNGKLDESSAGGRPDRARLHADRRPARLYRARAIGAIVYAGARDQFVRRPDRQHRASGRGSKGWLNIVRWSERGLNYWAVSDLAADELTEFVEKFEVAMRTSTTG